MEPTSTSFIPKKNLDSSLSARSTGSTVSVLTLLSTLIFIIVLGLSVGAFFYQKSISVSLEKDRVALKNNEKDFDGGLITQFQQLDSKLKEANSLLSEHVYMSHIFEFLQKNTISSIVFTHFGYSLSQDQKSVVLTLSGRAKDYASTALQADYFAGNSLVQSYQLSNPSLDTSTGNVTFNLSLTVDKGLIDHDGTSGEVVRPAPLEMSYPHPVSQAIDSTDVTTGGTQGAEEKIQN